MKRPWNDNDNDDNLQANEFYFARVFANTETTQVWICPITYFEKYGYCYDQSLGIGDLLPRKFHECMESCYSTDKDWDTIRKELLELGFQENKEFTDFIEGNE